MSDVIVKVSSFVVVILVGVLASRSKRFGDGAAQLLSRIVFTLTLPAAIVRAFQSVELGPSLLCLIGIGFLATVLPFFLSLAIHRDLPLEERVVQQANVCGFNIGCFALSFVQAFFPPYCVVATCLFDAGNSLMCTGGTWAFLRSFVLGTDSATLAERARLFAKTLFKSVPFDCYLLLILMDFGGGSLPQELIVLIEPFANANPFLSMFMIGLMIRFSINTQKAIELARLLGWRVGVSLALSLLAMFALPLDTEIRVVVAVLAWAPAASTGPLYTLWAGGDEGLAGMANAITVLIGVVAMTALVIWIGV